MTMSFSPGEEFALQLQVQLDQCCRELRATLRAIAEHLGEGDVRRRGKLRII
jgi:hypothetical protein